MPGVWHDCAAESENKEELATPKPTVVTGNNYVMGMYAWDSKHTFPSHSCMYAWDSILVAF